MISRVDVNQQTRAARIACARLITEGCGVTPMTQSDALAQAEIIERLGRAHSYLWELTEDGPIVLREAAEGELVVD